MNAVERFEAKFVPEALTGCWLWTAYRNPNGYGMLSRGTRDQGYILAHRFSYEQHRGSIPKGLSLDHLCRNPACVNPDHLEAVTQKENVLRGMSPMALNAKKTHCSLGHELSQRKGGRHCLACATEKQRQRRALKRAKADV